MDSSLRSPSRGRDTAVASTGRGGAGNIRSLSRDPVNLQSVNEDDSSDTRGRELSVSNKARSSGRGGAGNIRAASVTRSPSAGPNAGEREIIRQHIVDADNIPHSSGRGGAGNITTSRSRSRGPAAAGSITTLPPLHSSGRGGAGNMTRDGADPVKLAKVEAAEIMKHTPLVQDEPTMHSTGRGGIANITSFSEPADAKEVPQVAESGSAAQAFSSGRGGAGNIRYNVPLSTGEDEGERGRQQTINRGGVLQQVWDKVRGASSSRTRASDGAPSPQVVSLSLSK